MEVAPQRYGGTGHVLGSTGIQGWAHWQKDLEWVTSPIWASVPVLKLEDKNATFPTRQWLWKVPANANVPYLIFHVLFGGQGYFCPHWLFLGPELVLSHRGLPAPRLRWEDRVGAQGAETESPSSQSSTHPSTEQGVDTQGALPPLPAPTSFRVFPLGSSLQAFPAVPRPAAVWRVWDGGSRDGQGSLGKEG